MQVWSTPKEWCELLWDNSFVYQQHEKAAYSLAWNDAVFTEVLGESMNPGNPNNRVLPNRAYPEPCASYDFAKDADGNALATEVRSDSAPHRAPCGMTMLKLPRAFPEFDDAITASSSVEPDGP